MDHITISQIRILDAVEKEKNFSKAARLLGVSQPAVSLQLRELQKKYRIKIYFRRGKEIHLSGLGLELLKTGRKVLGLLNEMDATLKNAGDLLTGTLNIGLSCHYFVKGLLGKFMEKYPGVRVKASIGHSATLIAEIEACRMDIAEITALEPDPRFHFFKYSEQQILLFVSKHHPWAGKKEIMIESLHNKKMVALHDRSMTRQIFNRKLARFNVVPDIALELDNWDTMKETVAAGIGFGIALEDEFGPDDRLAKIRLKGSDFTAYQYFVCQPEYRDLKLISAFLDVAVAQRDQHRILKKIKTNQSKE